MKKHILLKIHSLLLNSNLSVNDKMTLVTVLLYDVTGATDLKSNLIAYEQWVNEQ